jgi:methylamine dehydrogenase light chain
MSHRLADACDGVLVDAARFLARRSSRRGFLGRLGAALVGGFVLPLLPVDRRGIGVAQAAGFGARSQAHDDTQCNYWRYCSSDGYLCACCGGGPITCPPGTSPSPTSWVVSCIKPDDQQMYLVMYRDCCGKEVCSRCFCQSSERELPVYRPQNSDAPLWCFGTDQMAYHCTHAALIGKS